MKYGASLICSQIWCVGYFATHDGFCIVMALMWFAAHAYETCFLAHATWKWGHSKGVLDEYHRTHWK